MFSLGLITARGGSRGVPGKNIRPIAGKPTVAHVVEAALAARTLDHVIISTDCPEIAAVARQYGCDVPFMRPAELARDDTPHAPVFHHAITTWEALGGEYVDILVNLQPTCPLMAPEDIDGVVERCQSTGAGRVFSVKAMEHPVEWAHWLDGNGQMIECVPGGGMQKKRRQDFQPAYTPSGGPLALRREVALDINHPLAADIRAVEMPAMRALDIDEEFDVVMVEAAYQWIHGMADMSSGVRIAV